MQNIVVVVEYLKTISASLLHSRMYPLYFKFLTFAPGKSCRIVNVTIHKIHIPVH